MVLCLNFNIPKFYRFFIKAFAISRSRTAKGLGGLGPLCHHEVEMLEGFFEPKWALRCAKLMTKKLKEFLEIDETFFADYDQIDTKRCNQVCHLLNFVSIGCLYKHLV